LVRAVVAICSVVVAACAVTVTVKVMRTDVVTIQQERVLDEASLERQVAARIQGLQDDDPVKVVSCPASVVVKVGNQFNCSYLRGSNINNAQIEVISDQGELSVKP
jgi:hypothetical protein